MSVYSEAAEAVEREAARAESLVKVAAALRAAGSLENAANESQARLTKAQDDLKAVEAAIADRQTALDDMGNHLTEVQAQLKAEREAHSANMRDQSAAAHQVAVDAEAEADKIVADAKIEAQSLADAYATQLVKDSAAAVDELARNRSALADVVAETATAQARLDDINRQIADLKARF